jgi:hypothetical protein
LARRLAGIQKPSEKANEEMSFAKKRIFHFGMGQSKPESAKFIPHWPVPDYRWSRSGRG